ncbi:MAG: DNA/RNA non-specific endonuclease [Tannerellaceae bacterium]|jgi:endonuclease G|nr:DNA/RNA non-specific endonuclease [Tannerellaceae bacterium]
MLKKFILFLCLAGLVYAYRFTKEERPFTGGEQSFTGEERPLLGNGQKEQIIEHEGFTVSYNPEYRIANWVAYELTPEEAQSDSVARWNKFAPDPDVVGPTATNDDYRNSGYDRGHLAPAGDMKWSAKAMRESFYFSNICPQNKGLNGGMWHKLEKQCRTWAGQHGTLSIVTGPVIGGELERLGKNRVGIPELFYKVIGCTPRGDTPKGIGFLFENRNYKNTSLRVMAVTVDSVEAVTGIDFFPSLPREIQDRMESAVDPAFWILR